MSRASKSFVVVLFVIAALCLSLTFSGCGTNPALGNNTTGNISQTGVALDARVESAKNGAKAIVSLSIDDGNLPTHEWINAAMDKYGFDFKVTIMDCPGQKISGIDTSFIEGPMNDYIDYPENLARMRAILSEGRQDLGSHGMSHFPFFPVPQKNDYPKRVSEFIAGLSEADQWRLAEYEIADSLKLMNELFPDQDVLTYAASNQVFTTISKEVADSTYDAIRGVSASKRYNPLNPSPWQWKNLAYRVITWYTTQYSRQAAVQSAIDNGRWFIENWHGIGENNGWAGGRMTEEDAINHFRFMQMKQDAGELWVASFTEATKYIKERQAVESASRYADNLSAVYHPDTDSIEISLKYCYEDLDVLAYNKDKYTYPLTVKVSAPEGWNAGDVKTVKINGDDVDVTVLAGSDTNFVYVNAVPQVYRAVENL